MAKACPICDDAMRTEGSDLRNINLFFSGPAEARTRVCDGCYMLIDLKHIECQEDADDRLCDYIDFLKGLHKDGDLKEAMKIAEGVRREFDKPEIRKKLEEDAKKLEEAMARQRKERLSYEDMQGKRIGPL